MKSILMVLAGLVITAGSLQAQEAKDNPRIKGSGNVITKEIPVSSFDQLNAQGVFSILLTQGNKEGVKIEADDNLQDLFEVKNEGSKLNISMKKNVNMDGNNKIKIYITFKTLKSMDLKTVGAISSSTNLNFDDLKISNKGVGSLDLKMTAQSLDVDNKGVGAVKLDGKATNAIIKNKGVGNVMAGTFVVEKMDIDNTGVGHAEVNATKELKVKDSFLGKVTNKGSATAKRINKEVI